MDGRFCEIGFFVNFRKIGINFLCAVPLSLISLEALGQNVDASVVLARTLSECNPQLIAQARRLDGSRASADGVRSERLPSFSVSAGAFQNNNGGDNAQSSITARLPVATFGRQAANENLSAARVQLAERKYVQSVAKHTQNLVDLWAERVSLESQMRIYEDTISEKQELVTVVERRAQEGLSSKAELRDARTEYLSDLTDLENLRLRLIEIDADIIVLGCEQLSVTQGNIPGSRETDIQTIGSSLNPELMVSRAELDVARAEAAYEEVSDFPGLDLEARVSVDDSGDTSSRIGLTINYEYNNFGRARLSNITESEMSVREQENLLRFLTTDLEQEVLADHQRSQLLTSQVIPSIQQELLSYEATLQSSIRRYEAGKLTIREVLSDINEIKQSKIAVEEALQQLEIFHNAIAYALGRYTIR